MLEEITFGAAQRVKLVQRIMTALAKCATLTLNLSPIQTVRLIVRILEQPLQSVGYVHTLSMYEETAKLTP